MIVSGTILRIHKRMANVASGFELPRCLSALATIEADVNLLVSALTDEQFHAPPRTGGWSVGYCVEHLVLTGQAFLPRWDQALKEAAFKPSHANGVVRYGWWQRHLLRVAEPPYSLKTNTAQPFVPCSRHTMEETIRRFYGMHQEIARRLKGSRGLDVKRIKIRSPFVSWLCYPLGFSFDLALAHERRHLWQAWQIRRQLLHQR